MRTRESEPKNTLWGTKFVVTQHYLHGAYSYRCHWRGCVTHYVYHTTVYGTELGSRLVLAKTKAVPLHATKALGGGRRYSSYSFSTSALDEDEWSVSRPDRALPPVKDPRYPLYRRLCGPQSRSGHRGKRKNPFASVGDQTSIARSSCP
jgi:hypothetical protein